MKINSILIGKGSGSAGNVTVLQLKGQTILKQKATIVSNPNTTKQQNQRKMISRAVIAWQMVGNVIRQGWTSLLPFSSQYNTYVSENAAFFKAATFTKDTFLNENLIFSVATKGVLGTLLATPGDYDSGDQMLSLTKANLNQVAKVGDKIVLIAGNQGTAEMSYGEVVVTQALLDSASPVATFADFNYDLSATGVYAAFVVSADGTKSSSSVWTEY